MAEIASCSYEARDVSALMQTDLTRLRIVTVFFRMLLTGGRQERNVLGSRT